MQTMPSAASKAFDSPDELRTPPGAAVAIVDLNGNKVARLTLEPGWRWSESVKPIAGTDTCQVHHLGVLVSGTMHVLGVDGAEAEIGAGTAYTIEPGHDAWVVGNDPVVAFEFDSTAAATFAARE
jgi:hypothetical protein